MRVKINVKIRDLKNEKIKKKIFKKKNKIKV